jgi:hypothetical protein
MLAGADGDPLLVLRHLRLTAGAAERLGAALLALAEEATDDGPGQPRYGLLVGLYGQHGG